MFIKFVAVVTYLIGTWVVGALIFALPTMLLWNWLAPTIFGFPELTVIQAAGLLLLSTFLLGRRVSFSIEGVTDNY